MKEIFKDIPGWEGYYQVSNLGRVKSLSRLRRNGSTMFMSKELILSAKTDKDGYKKVCFRKNLKNHHFSVHRLVLTTFKGAAPKDKNECMHRDDNPSNNHIDNLEWGSPFENNKQAQDRGRKTPRFKDKWGILHPYSKKVIQKDLNGNKLAEFNGIREASRGTDTFPASISNCCLGKFKTGGGYIWEYAT